MQLKQQRYPPYISTLSYVIRQLRHYVQTLLQLCRALRDERPGRKVILQHDNARHHTGRLTLEKIENMVWEVPLTLRTVQIWHPPITISLVL
jgi:hypothetical protein